MSISMNEIKEKVLKEFQCQQSGNCCRCPGIVHVTQKDIESMATIKNIPVFDFMNNYVIRQNGWSVVASTTFRTSCFLNEKNQCDVYQARPEQCRTYPHWPELWESEERVVKETALCPGLKKALNKAYPDGFLTK